MVDGGDGGWGGLSQAPGFRADRLAGDIAVRLAGADAARILETVDDGVDGLADRHRYWGPVRSHGAQCLGDERASQPAPRAKSLVAVNDELSRELAGHRRTAAAQRKEIGELQRSAADTAAMLTLSQELGQTGSFSWHPASGEIRWSEQACRIYGYEPAAPMTPGMIAARVHPEDLPALSDLIERAQRDASGFESEHRLWMPDCAVKYVQVVARAARDREGQLHYIGAVRDVTECRRLEQALVRMRSELACLARVTTLGVLAASIAHEVSQPLTGMAVNASTCLHMLAGVSPNLDDVRETVQRALRDCHRASEVVSRLRALVTGREVTAAKLDLNEIARETIALVSGELRTRRVAVRADLADGFLPVTGDCVQLQQVVLNLILNAADAMSSVEDRPRQLVITTERDSGNRICLAVQDTGIGFTPDAAARLFEAFYTTKRDGMGVGLAISRTIIESHGGVLSATSNQGRGATFSFSLPICAEAEPSATQNIAFVDKTVQIS